MSEKRDKPSMEVNSSLPANVFAAAMTDYLALQESRVRAMYNRHRALFAEHLVAVLLGGEVVKDPGAAWDVNWTPAPGRRLIRIQVKCSGEFLPRYPKRPAAAAWGAKPPTKGYDGTADPLPPGHHCDVFVLARHTGEQIATGWSFVVASREALKDRRLVNERFLRQAGLAFVTPADLAAAVRGVVGIDRPMAQ